MASSPLLSVPTELLLAVVEAIDDVASLRGFALTCKLACVLAEPVLYRAVLVTTGSQASRLAKALQQQQPSTRADLVQALDLRLAYSRDANVEVLTPLLGTMTQLRALSIESPFAIWHSGAGRAPWEALTQGFRTLFLDAQCGAGLQKLESLTIHWSTEASSFWLLREFKPILTLPALQSLTVSRAVLDDDLIDGLDAFAGTTPLTYLELIECFVSPKALTAVLALPRALRSCHLGFMRHSPSDPGNYHSASPEQHLEALHQQRFSLQQLIWFDRDFAYDTDVCRVSTIPGSGLYDFTELHTLTLDGASALLLSTLLSECAPRHLDRLRLIRHDTGTLLDHPADSVIFTRIPGIPPPFALHQHLPTLHYLDIVFLSRTYNTKLWTKPDRCDHVKRLGEDYHARGICLTIFAANRGGVVPPYLFGEEPPREKPVYHAENAWFSPEMT
ncbi:RNI-like protein [Mycena sanguinolenta]|uniref:RNI-like protein n=1 Tax=Mycena sanguinolenta TaxID=230812 RepID=A0A8H6YPF8_9AGAR|nr:RNI-like protein [Mycena sanguinolenta]